MFQPTTALRALLLALLPLTPPAAQAQSPGTAVIPTIQLKPDAKTTVIEGTVSPPTTVGPDMTSGGSQRYTLHARVGQRLTMDMTPSSRQALFSLIKPSPSMAKYETVARASGVKRWSGRLVVSGDYLVQVFTRERGAGTHYKLRITLR